MAKKERATQARMIQIRAAVYKLVWTIIPLLVIWPHNTIVAGWKMIFGGENPNKAKALFCFWWIIAFAIGVFVIQIIVDLIYGKTKDGDSWLVFAPRADSFVINLTNVLLIIDAISIVPVFVGIVVHHFIASAIIIAIVVLLCTSLPDVVGKKIKKFFGFIATCLFYIPITLYQRLKNRNII